MKTDINEKIYDMTLISMVKEQTGPKKLKKIRKNLRIIAEEDLKEFAQLKIKIFEEEKEKKEKSEFKIAAPIIGFQHFFEDFKKLNSKSFQNNNDENEGENTPSTVVDDEEVKQIDSSDFSDDD